MNGDFLRSHMKQLVLSVRDFSDPASVYDSIKKLRIDLIDKASIELFEKERGMQNLIILLKKFASTLISMLNRNLVSVPFDSEATVSRPKSQEILGDNLELKANLTRLVNELIALLANCTYIEPATKAVIKSSPLLLTVLSLLQVDSLPWNILSSILRLLGNVCDSNEFSLCVLQTKFMVATLIHWLNKLSFNDTGEEISQDLAQKNNQRLARSKVLFLALRLFRRLTLDSPSFVRFLLQNDLAYHLAKCLKSSDSDYYQTNLEIRGKIIDLLLHMASCQDSNFAEQLVRAQIFEEIMASVKNHDASFLATSPDSTPNEISALCFEDCPTRDLLFACIRGYSDARIDLSKFDAIEYMMALASHKHPYLSKTLALSMLCRFCYDAFTRVKLRESGALNLLIDAFEQLLIKEENRELTADLIVSFTCFLYDEISLETILRWKSKIHEDVDFVILLAHALSKSALANQCTAAHTLKYKMGNKTDHKFVEPTGSVKRNSSSELYRPDSPTYKRLKRDYSLEGYGKDRSMTQSETNLCKDFRKESAFYSPESLLCNTSRSGLAFSPYSSPGTCWSPANSTYDGMSPGVISNASFDLDNEGLCSEDVEHLGDFTKSEWFSDIAFAQNLPKSPRAPSLCDCRFPELTSTDVKLPSSSSSLLSSSMQKASDVKNAKRAKRLSESSEDGRFLNESSVGQVVLFLSTLSHNERYAECLVNDASVCLSILAYIRTVCRPQPRAGRMLKRLARDRKLTEKLLNFDFHRLIRQNLCRFKCEADPICVRCRKVCRIGCDILLSFRNQVDSDFGSGLLAHRILNDSSEHSSRYIHAVPYLIKSPGRRRKFLIEYKCIAKILEKIGGIEADAQNSFDSLVELVTTKQLKELWSAEISRRDDFSSSLCHFPTEIDPEDSERAVIFMSRDRSMELLADKTVLCENSDFYRSMFSGSFNESSKLRLGITESGARFKAFETFMHLLHGCRLCPSLECSLSDETNGGEKSVDRLLYCMYSADLHLRSDIFEYLVKYRAPRLLTPQSLSCFVRLAVLKNDYGLMELCAVYWLLNCSYADFLEYLGKDYQEDAFSFGDNLDDLLVAMQRTLSRVFLKFV